MASDTWVLTASITIAPSAIGNRCILQTLSKIKFCAAMSRYNFTSTLIPVNRTLVTDITFIPTRQGWLYVAAVLAMYSCKIVGWAMSNKADQVLASDALNMAITQRRPKAGVIHHKIFHYIEVFYNRQRKHSSLGYRSPERCERLLWAA